MMDRIRALFALLLEVFKILWAIVVVLINLLRRGRPGGGNRGEDCCIRPPESMRPRPDPYIYSQEWLHLRNLAVTWDNPDFQLIDKNGKTVDRMNLQPNQTYKVVVSVHNGSLMSAIGTTVALEVLEFGIGGLVISQLGSQTIDVPAFGVTKATFEWTTPSSSGHNCLRAQINHPDDGNPLNNVGQHNTEVAKPASPTRTSMFILRNHAPDRRSLRLAFDSYQLPSKPMRARSLQERNSLTYLRQLRDRNDHVKFPVPEKFGGHITIGDAQEPIEMSRPAAEIELDAGQAVFVKFEATPPSNGEHKVAINFHAFDEHILLGGVTIYIDPMEV